MRAFTYQRVRTPAEAAEAAGAPRDYVERLRQHPTQQSPQN